MQMQGVRITQGRILPNIIRFAIPIVFSNILQITFNAVDVAVVGWFCGSNAVASVGATTSLIHLLLNLFIGLATGTNIAVSFSLGMENREEAGKHAHNAVAVSLFSGVVVALLALWMARPALTAMATPAGEILDGAVLYFRIYFLGAPFLLLYNFGSAILRANGDSERPFLYLSLGGVANVILNIVLVLVFDMTVDGVAIATVLSNMISASLAFRHLLRMEGPCRVTPKKIRIHKKMLLTVLKFGLPAGIQNCMFSLPNLMIQSSINTFGAAAVAGNTAGTNVCGYCETTTAAFSETSLTFVARNLGAGKIKRVGKICRTCLLSIFVCSLTLGLLAYGFHRPLLSLFVPGNEEAIEYGRIRLLFLAIPNFIGAFMSVMTAIIRGLGKPFYPMITTVFGVCVVRVIWLLTVFPLIPTIECVYFTYPFTWLITSIALSVYFIYVYCGFKAKQEYVG